MCFYWLFIVLGMYVCTQPLQLICEALLNWCSCCFSQLGCTSQMSPKERLASNFTSSVHLLDFPCLTVFSTTSWPHVKLNPVEMSKADFQTKFIFNFQVENVEDDLLKLLLAAWWGCSPKMRRKASTNFPVPYGGFDIIFGVVWNCHLLELRINPASVYGQQLGCPSKSQNAANKSRYTS